MLKGFSRYINRRRLLKTLRLLRQLDNYLQNTGISRQERRYFWRAMAKDDERDHIIARIEKQAKFALGNK